VIKCAPCRRSTASGPSFSERTEDEEELFDALAEIGKSIRARAHRDAIRRMAVQEPDPEARAGATVAWTKCSRRASGGPRDRRAL